MANQNLFEKYGIKEVADVTLYRIDKKEETYESQRQISAASVLKGALELRDVYPLNDNGVGDEEGFKAYVFTDATINEGINYDCDDELTVTAKFFVGYDASKSGAVEFDDEEELVAGVKTAIDDILGGYFGVSGVSIPAGFRAELKNAIEVGTGVPTTADKIRAIATQGTVAADSESVGVEVKFITLNADEDAVATATMEVNVKFTATDTADAATGVGGITADAKKAVGTHEYSYAE